MDIGKLPISIAELSMEDVQLLLKAARVAGQKPQFMENPEASFRLGWIIGILYREISMKSYENPSES